MATSSIVLDIKANTDRALNDFKRFSAQLDNKFLVSGLKLDVVRSALGQINREFQKAIGEQGLQAGQSLRAAQNQAALLINTFKTIGPAASESIANDFSSAFSEIAVRAGGTAKDIQKALSAVPFISTDLPEDMRKALGKGVMEFQRDFSRAGLGDTYGNIIREFLAGQTTAGQLANSTDPLKSMVGTELTRLGGTQDLLPDAKQRSSVVKAFQESQQMRDTLAKMVDRVNYGQYIIQDLNTYLFNPEKGVFGVLRKVTMGVQDKTTIFIETRDLIESVFGRQGLFVNFFKQIAKIFGIEDPLKVIIIGVRFITKQFEALNAFIQSSQVQDAIKFATETFTRVKDFFTSLYKEVSKDTFDKEYVIQNIKNLGEVIRSYIKKIGDAIGGKDVTKETEFGSSIVGTLAEEMGKTMLALMRDIGGALLLKAPEIGLSLSGELVKALGNVISTAFQDPLTGTLATAAGGFLAYKGLRAVGGAVGGIRKIRNSPGGMLGAVDRHFGSPFRVGSNSITPGEARTMGFHSQVIARMDAIIRILAGGGATDIDYGGPSSPVGGGPRRGGGRGTRLGRDGRSANQRLAAIRNLRAQRGGLSGAGARLSGIGRAWSAMPGWSKLAVLGGIGAASIFGFASRGNTAEIPQKPGEMPPEFQDQMSSLKASGASQGEMQELRKAQKQELERQRREAQKQKVQEGRENTRGWLGLGTSLAGGLAGAKAGMWAGTLIGGGPWGTAIGGFAGGLAGSLLGEQAVKLLSNRVLDGIGKLAGTVGNFFSKDVPRWWKQNISDPFSNAIKLFGIDLPKTFMPRKASGDRPSGQNGDGERAWWERLLGREVGGPVVKGTSYIVGERGPEIFTPDRTGTISSNRELMALALGSRGYSGSSVSANFNISINVNGNMGAGDIELLRAPVLRIIEEAWATATQGSVSRGVVG